MVPVELQPPARMTNCIKIDPAQSHADPIPVGSTRGKETKHHMHTVFTLTTFNKSNHHLFFLIFEFVDFATRLD